jgi:two-component system, chemotaxis family, CheB/CheR fusion protein
VSPLPEAANGTTEVTRAELDRLRLLAGAIEHMGEGVAVFDLSEHLVYANPVYAAMHGAVDGELEGRHVSWFVDLSPEMKAQRRRDQAAGIEVTRQELMPRNVAAGEATVQVTVSALRDDEGARIGQVVCILDVTARKALETRMERAAWHDPLTGLPNRALLFDRLERALTASRRTGRLVATLFIDLDMFKDVNDAHGHDIGDQLLLQASERLMECVRESDTLARLGGDEFVAVLLDVDDVDQGHSTAVRMLDWLSTPFVIGDLILTVTASIGIATASSGRPREVLLAADSAMYEAKSAGRGRLVMAAGLSAHLKPPSPADPDAAAPATLPRGTSPSKDGRVRAPKIVVPATSTPRSDLRHAKPPAGPRRERWAKWRQKVRLEMRRPK